MKRKVREELRGKQRGYERQRDARLTRGDEFCR
jgi:hypothetical protein